MKKPQAWERVRCFDEASGQELWSYAYEVTYPVWAFNGENSNGPTATPAVADGKVDALGGSGEVMCLAAATGELLWRKDYGKDYEVPTLLCRASPLIEGELVILQLGGKSGACMIAVERSSGRMVWKALDEPVSSSSPIIITAGGRRQLIVWTGESGTSLDPATGTTFWREPMTTSSNDDIATPVCLGDRLLISGLMFKLDAEKPAATVLWPENRGVSKRVLSNTSTPLLTGDAVYSATNLGDLVCLDARTGQELWRTDKITDRKSGASIHLTPNGDAIFLYTDRGELIRARLNPAGYEEISRTRLLEPLFPFAGRKLAWAAPAYANRHVFVRNERELICASLTAEP
jgi:outer membrane protein assembly factor BamB